MQDIVGQLPSNYAQPAKDLRLPYWDPFQKSQQSLEDSKFIPALLTDPKISLKNPNLLKIPFVAQLLTQSGSVVNPLFNYTFPKNPDKVTALAAGTQTKRSVNASIKLKGDIDNVYPTIIVNVMTNLDNFNAFTNDRFLKGSIGDYASLEQIHNLVHADVGGNMGLVPIAAFDPIFWQVLPSPVGCAFKLDATSILTGLGCIIAILTVSVPCGKVSTRQNIWTQR